MQLYYACMGERTERGVKARNILEPRFLAGVFCSGMFVGLIVKSLVPGVFGGWSGVQPNVAQMDGLLSEPQIHRVVQSPARNWDISITPDMKVADVKSTN
jgi:hypothetical protein